MSTKIEWATETWNPVTGCTKVSTGCKNCYAERMAKRLAGMGRPEYHRVVDANGWTGKVELTESRLSVPLHWRKPQRIFPCSMSDLFHEGVPFEFVDRIMAVAALCPQHTFMCLTKRAKRQREYGLSRWQMDDSGRVDHAPQWYQVVTQWLDEGDRGFLGKGWARAHRAAEELRLNASLPPNVHLGVTVENQETANERIPLLLDTPAAVRFVSAEPLLGALDLRPALPHFECRNCGTVAMPLTDDTRCKCRDVYHEAWKRVGGLDGVIVGGESGPGARPMHPKWAKDIRDQCVAAGVPYFHKQNGEWQEDRLGYVSDSDILLSPDGTWLDPKTADTPEVNRVRRFGTVGMSRVGKKKAGRLLDGRTWDQMPGKRC